MQNLVKIRAQAAICMQRAASDFSNRAHWLAEAERWSSLAQDEIRRTLRLFSQMRLNEPLLDRSTNAANSPFDADSTQIGIGLSPEPTSAP